MRRLPDYVVMTITGDLLEREPQVPWYYDYLPMYTTPLSIEYIRRVLQRVADEPNVRGIVFLFKGTTIEPGPGAKPGCPLPPLSRVGPRPQLGRRQRTRQAHHCLP